MVVKVKVASSLTVVALTRLEMMMMIAYGYVIGTLVRSPSASTNPLESVSIIPAHCKHS